MSERIAADRWRRIHPLTIFLEVVRFLGRSIWTIGIFILIAFAGGGGDRTEILFTLLGVFAVASPLISYFTTFYAIDGEHLVLRTGLFQRKLRTVPLANIQHIDFKRGVLHRLFGLVDVSVETAAGAGSEVTLSALTERDAQALRTELFAVKGAAPPVLDDDRAKLPGVPHHRPITAATLRDLIVCGALHNHALRIVLGFLGIVAFGFQLMGENQKTARGAIGAIARLEPTPAMIVVTGVALLFAGWVLSMARNAITYYGFGLRRSSDRLHVKYGLFTQFEQTLPIRRIQTLDVSDTWLMRRVGFCEVQASSPYFASVERSAENKTQTGGKTVLSPALHASEAGRIVAEVFPGLDLPRITFHPVAPIHRLRSFNAVWMSWTLLVIPVAWFWTFWAALAIIPILLYAALYARTAYARLGWHLDARFLVVRSGAWNHLLTIVPIGRVQFASWDQSSLRAGIRARSRDVSASPRSPF